MHQIKDDTPIFNRQVTKDCTQQLGHHACFTCEVNGFVQIPYMRVACTSSYSFLISSAIQHAITQCKKLDIRYGIFLVIFENTPKYTLEYYIEI